MSSSIAPVLIAGEWRSSHSTGTFQADNPTLGKALPESYPVSSREEVLEAIRAGCEAADALRRTPGEAIARFLEAFADGIEARRADLVALAHAESGLPEKPRLKVVELPRTTNQLRLAAKAAREGTWREPIRDEAAGIYSVRAPLGGPVVVMGPNNFPFAFNSVAGGDFAAALAAHNPVIAKANTSHPGTTRLLAEIAREAVESAGLHPATVQLIYRTPREVGLELVSHPLVGATGFTGSKAAGLQLKDAADRAGKPIYLEMSSVNPVVVLEGALRERGEAIAEEFFGSCTMGAGQFCTNPGFLVLPDSEAGRAFVQAACAKFAAGAPGVLLGKGGRSALVEAVGTLRAAGATVLVGGEPAEGPAYRFQNTLLQVTGEQFLQNPHDLQTEAFGPVSLLVMSSSTAQTVEILRRLEGNLTGTIYSDTAGSDDADYAAIEPPLRQRVGRLLNDKMPTGVAVSPAMNHGGPYPATGHPGFTAVGLPTSISRFTALHCYDNVRPERLPEDLR
ncbi:MAG: aldehyde dehydrogenase (NADP(+)) [Armatimonadota bacterium]